MCGMAYDSVSNDNILTGYYMSEKGIRKLITSYSPIKSYHAQEISDVSHQISDAEFGFVNIRSLWQSP